MQCRLFYFLFIGNEGRGRKIGGILHINNWWGAYTFCTENPLIFARWTIDFYYFFPFSMNLLMRCELCLFHRFARHVFGFLCKHISSHVHMRQSELVKCLLLWFGVMPSNILPFQERAPAFNSRFFCNEGMWRHLK